MRNIAVRGKQYEGDIFDVDFLERYEAAAADMQAATDDIRRNGRGGVAEGFRALIGAVDDFFNAIFGEGTAEELFGDAPGNLRVHFEAVDEFVTQVDAQKKELNDMANRCAQKTAARAKPQGQKAWAPQSKPRHR